MGHPTTSVVICAYTEARWAQTQAAVASVQGQTVVPEQCILVVDHNAPLLDRARAALPSIEVVPSDGPPGLSGARNTGVARATGEVVVFLDDDAVAEPSFLAELLEWYADPQVAGAGGRVLPAWPTARPAWFPLEFDWVVGCGYRGLPEEPAPVRNMIGAAMSFRRSALSAAGPFDTGVGRVGRLPFGCEETELSIRVRRALPGSELVYVPTATVAHTVSPDRVTFRYFFRRCLAEGRSKALVAARVGAGQALQSEREHVRRALPAGVIAGVRAALHGERSGLARAAMIVSGLVVTAVGFAAGQLGGIAARRTR